MRRGLNPALPLDRQLMGAAATYVRLATKLREQEQLAARKERIREHY